MVIILGALIFAAEITSTNIAWQAHLGGLVLGLAAGFYFRRQERGRFWG
jgi:membrane associated rhomboid family serine protease